MKWMALAVLVFTFTAASQAQSFYQRLLNQLQYESTINPAGGGRWQPNVPQDANGMPLQMQQPITVNRYSLPRYQMPRQVYQPPQYYTPQYYYAPQPVVPQLQMPQLQLPPIQTYQWIPQ